MPRDDALRSTAAYRLLRYLHVEASGATAMKLSRQHDIPDDRVEQLLSGLHRLGVLEKEREEGATYYRLSQDGMYGLFRTLWMEQPGSRISADSIGAHLESSEMRAFLQGYVEAYLQEHDRSTVERMLVDDFYHDLRAEARLAADGDLSYPLPDWLRAFWSDVDDYYATSRSNPRTVRSALTER